jgi:hypothetical protein
VRRLILTCVLWVATRVLLLTFVQLFNAIRRDFAGTDTLSSGLGAYLSLGVLIVVPATFAGSAIAWRIGSILARQTGKSFRLLLIPAAIELACTCVFMLCATPAEAVYIIGALVVAVSVSSIHWVTFHRLARIARAANRYGKVGQAIDS